MTEILKKAPSHFQEKLPFVIYSKPNSSQLNGVFQNDSRLHEINDYTENGFVFVSFDGITKIVIPENDSFKISEEIDVLNEIKIDEVEISENDSHKYEHIRLIQKGIETINDGQLYKIVLSRVKEVKLSDFEFITVFKNLLYAYPSAFSYCFYHPKVGMWMGAFSEQLVNCNNSLFSTMAVAGTQKKESSIDVTWQKKEKQEQQFVSDFIIESLQEKTSEIYFSEPYTLVAGNLLHIKTDIWGKLNDGLKLSDLISVLHPTPAVCGLPKEQAKRFILENENYNREFYAGFLGELNMKNNENQIKTDLYVNLRCMKIINNQAFIYVGGGITKDSIPEKEWTETVNKSKTILNILS